MPDADAANGRIPQWAARGAFICIAALVTVGWATLATTISAKAEESDVTALARKVEEIECDVDYLSRKAEADVQNDAVTRRILDDLARAASQAAGVTITPGGPLVEPRPSERMNQ